MAKNESGPAEEVEPRDPPPLSAEEVARYLEGREREHQDAAKARLIREDAKNGFRADEINALRRICPTAGFIAECWIARRRFQRNRAMYPDRASAMRAARYEQRIQFFDPEHPRRTNLDPLDPNDITRLASRHPHLTRKLMATAPRDIMQTRARTRAAWVRLFERVRAQLPTSATEDYATNLAVPRVVTICKRFGVKFRISRDGRAATLLAIVTDRLITDGTKPDLRGALAKARRIPEQN